MVEKIRRNDPCWCGSGRKYKKCHSLIESQLKSGKIPTSPRDKFILSNWAQDRMRDAGAFNAQLMDHIRPMVVAGTTTLEIDKEVKNYTESHGHTCACIGYKGFPRASCTSINEVVCHGIPDGTTLKNGDIINVDLTTKVNGWHGDSSETFLVGDVDDEARKLVQCAFDCLHIGIAAICPYGKVDDIAQAITKHAHSKGFSVVRDFYGHGIGRKFHQDPTIPHYPSKSFGSFIIKPGMCFTIEPMINAGTWKITKEQQWNVKTIDSKRSAQFEYTILMTDIGPEVLTFTKNGPKFGYKF